MNAENGVRKNPQMKISEKIEVQQINVKCDLPEVKLSREFRKAKTLSNLAKMRIEWCVDIPTKRFIISLTD